MTKAFLCDVLPGKPVSEKNIRRDISFYGEKDYGLEMENSHHEVNEGDSHLEAEEFTIFDWGNGSASASLAELLIK